MKKGKKRNSELERPTAVETDAELSITNITTSHTIGV